MQRRTLRSNGRMWRPRILRIRVIRMSTFTLYKCFGDYVLGCGNAWGLTGIVSLSCLLPFTSFSCLLPFRPFRV